MNEESLNLYDRFIEFFSKNSKAKYVRGSIEHEGDIRDMSAEQLLNEAIWENIDQAIYLFALKERLYGENVDE